MKSKAERFLGQFDSATATQVVEFGKRISAIDADVIVLMARKAVCFVDCLQDLNLANLTATVVSDRVLDMDREWLSNKTVSIIDDALISGTTLHRTRGTLLEAGASAVTTHVFCVDNEWWARDLAMPVPPYNAYSAHETTAFCAAIVSALSLHPRPYAIDYPMFSGLRIPGDTADVLATLPDWQTYDISSSLQAAHNIASLTAVPSEEVLRQFNRRVGVNLSPHCQLHKVRLYVQFSSGKRHSYRVRAMPLVTFDPLTSHQIDQLWEGLVMGGEIENTSFARAFATTSSRLRLLQYVASAILGELWLGSLSDWTGRATPIVHELRSLSYLFCPHLAEDVRGLCHTKRSPGHPVPLDLTTPQSPAPASIPTRPFKEQSIWSLQATLTAPFLALYSTDELTARRLALRYGRAAFEKPEYAAVMRRLSRGYSLPQLRGLIAGFLNDADTALAVSLFLDCAKDRGIAVPIVVEQSDVVFRAFRHGEDVEFSECEARLCCLMLAAFASAAGERSLPRLWVEKLVVILIRIGVHRQFLTRWTGTLGDSGTVGVRYALHGAVAKIGATKLYEYNPESSLTRLFVESGYLRETADHKYSLGTVPTAPTRKDADDAAEIIGSIFGTIMAGRLERVPLLNDDELTILATCLYPNDAAGAVAAGIQIFQFGWPLLSRAFGKPTVPPAECARLLTDIKTKATFEGVISGAWKYRSSKDQSAWSTIERIGRELNNAVYRGTWRGFWPSAGKQGPHAVSRELGDLLDREGAWSVKVSLWIAILELALRKGMSSAPASEPHKGLIESPAVILGRVRKYRRELERFSDKTNAAAIQYAVKAERELMTSDGDWNSFRTAAVAALDLLAAKSAPILDLVDTVVTTFGRPRPIVRYSHVLHIALPAGPRQLPQPWKRIKDIIRTHRGRVDADGRRRPGMDVVPPSGERPDRERWVCAGGELSRARLVNLARELVCELSDAGIRLTLLADLPDEEQPVRAIRTSDYSGKHFWARAADLRGAGAGAQKGAALTVVTPATHPFGTGVQAEVTQGRSFPVAPVGLPSQFVSARPVRLGFTRRVYAADEKRVALDQCDIGVITIVPEEMRAIREMLKQGGAVQKIRGKKSKRLYSEGTLPRTGGGHHRIVAVQQLEQGNRSVMAAYEALSREYSPPLIVLFGIAGSISDEFKIGDVVFGDQVVYYDKRKEKAGGMQRRGEADKVPSWLKVFINDFFTERGASLVVGDSLFEERQFKVGHGPIGAGEGVIGYRDAPVRKWLTDFNDKTAALETESGGLVQSFYEDCLWDDSATRGYLVIRGISDHADEEKDDRHRQIASRNAASALSDFFQMLPDLRTHLN